MHLSAVTLALFALSAASAAQDPIATAGGLTDHGGRVLGSGAAYTLELDAAGAVFTPALGPEAPVTRSLSLSRASLSVGGAPLAIATADADAAPTPRLAGEHAVYDLAPGITERWSARRDGAELSYVLAERPAAEGDFVVTLDVATNLIHRSGDAQQGWLYLDDDGNGVRVGGVTGIGADGAKTTGWVEARDGELALGLPAAFVRDAAYPLVLDPVLGPVFGVGSGPGAKAPDAAAMTHWSQRLTVWELQLSASDTAIQGQIHSWFGTPVGGLITIAATGANTNPASGVLLKSATFETRFQVVYEQRLSPTNRDILCTELDRNGVVIGTTAVADSSKDEYSPDVTTAFNSVEVVWVRDGSGIRRNQIEPGPTVDPAGQETLTSSGFARSPAITENQNSTPFCVWVFAPPTGDHILQGVPLNGSSPPITDLVTSSAQLDFPAIDAHSAGDYICAYEESTGTAGSHDIWGLRFRYESSGAVVVLSEFKLFTENGSERHPAVAGSPGQVMVAASRDIGAGPEVAMRFLDPLTQLDIEPEVTAPLNALNRPAAVGVNLEYSTDIEFQTVWTDLDSSAGGDVVYAQIAGDANGSTVYYAAAGCDSFFAALQVGAAYPDNPVFRSELVRAQPGAVAVMAIGFIDQSIPLGAGTLVPTIDFFFPTVLDANGYTGVELPLPPGISGLTFWEQWAVIGPGTGCAGTTYDLTDALQVTVE